MKTVIFDKKDVVSGLVITEEEETTKFCACGCGEPCKPQNEYINYHNRKNKNKWFGKDNPNWKNKVDLLCSNCGKPFQRVWQNEFMDFCSASCCKIFMRGKNSPFYKTGSRIDVHGYKLINVEGEYFYEHRLIMEKALGRKLIEIEIVHHKDGDRLNNNLTNLELMNKNEHDRMHTIKRHREEKQFGKK